MANRYDQGIDDYRMGKEIKGDPGLEYLRGYYKAEDLYNTQNDQQSEQRDEREPEYLETQNVETT